MDQVIRFCEVFGYPLILHRKSSKLSIAWCFITLIWFTYHYTHLWAYSYLDQIYDYFDTSTLYTGAEEHPPDTASSLAKLLYIGFELIFSVAFKIYLLVAYFRRNDPTSLYHVVRRLEEAFSSLKAPPSKIFTRLVSLLLALLLIATCVMSWLGLDLLLACIVAADQCSMPYFTPGLDHVGEPFEVITICIGNTFLPLLASVASLQFAVCVKSIIATRVSLKNIHKVIPSIDQLLIHRLVDLFDALIRFNRHLEDWLFVLISLYALDLMTTVSLIARQVTKAAHYSIIFLSLEFCTISLLSYSSSRAVEAKKRLIEELIRVRMKIETHRSSFQSSTAVVAVGGQHQTRPAILDWFDSCIDHFYHCDVEISGSGFFTLNKSLILTLIGLCFTYAIILIQNH